MRTPERTWARARAWARVELDPFQLGSVVQIDQVPPLPLPVPVPVPYPILLSAGVHRHDARPAEPKVVLQCRAHIRYLPLVGLPAQLPDQLGALRQTCRTERMSL